ncbi:MAG: UDP-N-acetylmuramoyl-tripeptide--D-alanyl-D-alanine ligase, partial [Verrucomicrobiales bacterium]|nr:UDP-N-acetylmuramoyl-tripeptide--D-alanyl-D-alanine ligase [Verrucomicrobiales bacterium]
MKPLPLQTLAAFCGGTLHGGDPARLASRVTTDSRQVQPGQVFVALKGDRFDGQAFVPAVAAAGAAAVVISEEVPGLPESCAAIRVADTLRALQRLAHEYRLWHRPRLIALTGSNGKTSTKDLSRAVLSRSFRVRATVGNLNNHIGLPLTLLSLEEGDEISLTEMGMNHAGEIRELVDIAQPDDAILTNVGHAHIEYFGSQDAIAWEKATLPANISRDGTVVLNAEDAYTPLIARHCQGRVLRAGIDAGEIRATDLQPDASGTRFTLHTPAGEATLRLPIPGRHMISNATLAAAIGWARGIAVADIAAALEEVTLTGGRLQTRQIRGVDFLDDSYNANP